MFPPKGLKFSLKVWLFVFKLAVLFANIKRNVNCLIIATLYLFPIYRFWTFFICLILTYTGSNLFSLKFITSIECLAILWFICCLLCKELIIFCGSGFYFPDLALRHHVTILFIEIIIDSFDVALEIQVLQRFDVFFWNVIFLFWWFLLLRNNRHSCWVSIIGLFLRMTFSTHWSRIWDHLTKFEVLDC